jgi:Rha family phage regulatory protein
MSESTAISLPADAVTLVHGHPVTTSLAVAQVFGQRHDNLLRTIHNVLNDCPAEFGRLNFEESSYLNEQGKAQPMYQLRKNAFDLLVMGFTGRQAMRVKVAYIECFDAMEAYLRTTTPAVHAALLAANPAWAIIARCARGELTHRELAKLLGCSETTVSRHLARMSACGLRPTA